MCTHTYLKLCNTPIDGKSVLDCYIRVSIVCMGTYNRSS